MISFACAALLLATPLQEVSKPPAFPVPDRVFEQGPYLFHYKSSHEYGAAIPKGSSDVWAGVKSAADSNTASAPAMPKLKVKIYLFPETLTVARYNNNYTADRTLLVGPERDAFDNSVKQYVDLLKASGFDPQVSLTEDNDILVLSDPEQAAASIASIMAPDVNDQRFAGEDPVDHGPFDVILALTTVPMSRSYYGWLDQTPACVIPLTRLSPMSYDVDLAAYLFSATKWQLTAAKLPGRLPIQVQTKPSPVVPGPDMTLAKPVDLFGRMPAPPVVPLPTESPLHSHPVDSTAVLLPDGKLAVTGMGTWLLAQAMQSANPPKLSDPERGLDYQGRVWTMYKAEGYDSLDAVFGVTPPAEAKGETAIPESGPLPLDFKPYGFFRPTKPLTSLEPIPNTFTQFGYCPRGGVTLVQRRQIPVIAKPEGKALTYSLKSDTREILCLQFFGKDGERVGQVQISGPKQAGMDMVLRKSFTGKDFQTSTIPLNFLKSPVYRIALAVPDNPIPSSAIAGETKFIEFGSFVISPQTGDSFTDEAQPIDVFDRNAPNAELERLAQGSNSEVAIAALGALADQPVESQAAFFGSFSRSASSAAAYMGSKALAQLKSPEAKAEILKTLNEGPFDFNRRFAAMAVSEPGEKGFLDIGNLLLTARSWNTRLQGARLIAMTKSDAAQTYLVASLFDPSVNVRGEIAKLLDPDNILSGRRLLYLAVNDASEDIRATCYTKLLDAKDAALVGEALKGVKDESRLVRLAILAKIMAKPDEKYRATYRIAVLDKDPVVQALVLKAFSQLPEPVELGEVANTVGSPAIPVQLALLQLAQSKQFKLPAEELARLAASPEKAVSDLAKKLQGGTR
ncbi:MAG: hypothetical protein JNM28_11485 [Armatimonadetes bacterium]|nr:hypothetical protein [Armatimonadota bacterium]